MPSQLDLDAVLAFAIQLALDAGQMIRDGQAKRFASGTGQVEKANSVDLVTEVDKAVEAFITEQITSQYPDHKFIGEETYTGQEITDEPTWIVDPIDGTTNFIHGHPMVSTSIGLTVKGVPVVGVVYAPFMHQLYSAAQGRGAYLNQKTKLPLSGTPLPLASLKEALIAVEWGTSREDPAMDRKLQTFRNLLMNTSMDGKMCHSLRHGGSAALNAAMVGSGAVDVYWEIGPWPWDVCAASCIVREAGGAVYGAKGTQRTMDGTANATTLAGRKHLMIRALPEKEGEKAAEAQKKLAEEFYGVVEEWDA